ncbi:unnamed protein product [Camellia sinensis]
MRGIGGPVLGNIGLIWSTFVVPLDGISALTLVFALLLSFMGIQQDDIFDLICMSVSFSSHILSHSSVYYVINASESW